MARLGAGYEGRMTEHPKSDDVPELQDREDDERDPEKVIPEDQTAPGMGEVEIGGESLDP